MENEVDFNDPILSKWLDSIMKNSTKIVYRTAYRGYANFTKMKPEELVDEAIEDAKKDVRERKDIVKSRMIAFYNYLRNEYPIRGRGNTKQPHEILHKGLAPKTANGFVQAVRSFYSTYDIYVKLKGRSKLPTPKVINKRIKLTPEDIKKLIDHARTPRDRAIILTMFQSGLDVSTLCNLKYGDVRKGLETNEYPLKLETVREKTGVQYYTFLGKDAIEAVKAYINDAKARGIKLNDNTPLFIKSVGNNEPIETHLVQKVIHDIGIISGLVDKKNNGYDLSPLNPHALRESFSTIMANTGVQDSIVDFWLGHTLGELSKTYQGKSVETLKKTYLEHEQFISLSAPKTEIKEIEKELEEQRVISKSLVESNLEFKKRIDEQSISISELSKNNEKLREELNQKISKEESIKILEDMMQTYLTDPARREVFGKYFLEAVARTDLHERYEDDAEVFIVDNVKVKPDKVDFTVSTFGEIITINIRGYWLNGKFFEIPQSARITIKQ